MKNSLTIFSIYLFVTIFSYAQEINHNSLPVNALTPNAPNALSFEKPIFKNNFDTQRLELERPVSIPTPIECLTDPKCKPKQQSDQTNEIRIVVPIPIDCLIDPKCIPAVPLLKKKDRFNIPKS